MEEPSRLPNKKQQDEIRWYEHIKRERLKKGLSQEKAAERLRVDERTLRFWEAGSHIPNYGSRRNLSRFYQKSLEELDLINPQLAKRNLSEDPGCNHQVKIHTRAAHLSRKEHLSNRVCKGKVQFLRELIVKYVLLLLCSVNGKINKHL